MVDLPAGVRVLSPMEMRLVVAHRTRLNLFGVPTITQHEREVVARALATLRGVEPMPESHAHGFEEMGCCVECDAAAALTSALTAEGGRRG